MIKRKMYLEDIIPFYNEELSINVDKEPIIYINFEDVFYSDVNYIVSLSVGKKYLKRLKFCD